MPKGSPSVLIIRLDGIGDALALTPLLAALHSRHIPVDVVLHELNADVFSTRGVRRVIRANFVQRSHSNANLMAIARLGQELREQAYSHVLVATEDPAGYRLASAVEAPARIGFHNGWGKPLKRLWSRRLLTSGIYRSAGIDPRAPHECEDLFRLATPLFGNQRPTRDLTQLRPLVLESEPAVDYRVGVQLTEKWQRLGIRLDQVVELIRSIAQQRDVRLFSSQSEAWYAARIAQARAMTVEYFRDVNDWKAAIGSAAALIAPDCGALQVAGMIGTPVIAVFPPSPHFALQVARWAPWASPQRIVRADRGWPAQAADALADILSTAPAL